MKKKVIIEFSERWLKVYSGDKVIFEPIGLDILNITAPLAKVFQQLGQKKGIEVLVVLSRSKVTLRKLDLPSREPAEIESMLGLHVIRQVPYPKEEIVWGYQNLGFDGLSNSHILLAIVHREILRNIFHAFISLNILPEAMLISSQGIVHYLQNSLKDKTKAQAYLILDIDYNFSDLMLVTNGNLSSSLIISRGSEQLNSEEEREKFNAELRQALVVFNTETPKPTLFFLSGAGAFAEPLIKDYIEKDFNLKFLFLKGEEAKNVAGADEISCSAALGFYHQRKKSDISFTLPEAQIKKEIKLKVRQLAVFGACLTYIFILLGALAFIRINQLQSYRDKLNERVSQLKQSVGGVSQIADKINIVRKYWNADESATTYIYELVSAAPDNITMTNFNWQWHKQTSIRGYASEIPDISNFVKSLNNTKVFKDMQTRYMRRRKIKDREAVDFEVASK